ncbi:hypothetical protein SAMN05216377_1251, partial [Pseudonocardia oroxyli]
HSDRAASSDRMPTRAFSARRSYAGRWDGSERAQTDNAAMESFLSLLQKNVLNRRRWSTRAELRLTMMTWIERTHHRRRRQDSLGRLTPVESEILTSAAHAA